MRTCLALLLIGCGPSLVEHEHEDFEVLRQGLAGNPLRRPHWGSLSHGDSGGSQWASGKFPYFTAPRWPGCHKTTYYLIDASILASWKPYVRAAFAAWDQPSLCSPHWVETTSATQASVRVRRSATSGCDPTNNPALVWFACAQRDAVNASTLSQRWQITLNADHPFRIATAGYHDVQSIVAVELAHVHHGGHNPNWNDSISQANAARWGNVVTRAGSTGGEVQSQTYTVCPSDSSLSCTYKICAPKAQGGCGNMRKLLTGDRALLTHIYGANANGCATPGATRTKCTRCCGTGNLGTLVQTCTSAHAWNAGTCTVVPSPVVVDAGVRDAGVRDAGSAVVDAGVDEEEPIVPDPVEPAPVDNGFDGVELDPDSLELEPNYLSPRDSPDPSITAPELEPDEVLEEQPPPQQLIGGCSTAPGALLLLAALAIARSLSPRRGEGRGEGKRPS